MTLAVAVREFEGPLGVLLELVERGRLEVTAISVAEVTRQYLARIEPLKDNLTPEEISEFLQLGCRLVYIKSLALLPREAADEQAEELRQLNMELGEYRRYQLAARELAKRSTKRSWQRRSAAKLATEELPLPELKLSSLGEAFTRALRRTKPLGTAGRIAHQLSQHEIEQRLLRRLGQGSFELDELLDAAKDRFEVVVLFSALLELMRTGVAKVRQAGQFDAIMVEAA